MNKNTQALSAVTVGIALIIAIAAMAGPSANAGHVTQIATVNLGAAASYAVFAAATITNDTGPTTINGDLGLHPGTAVTETGVLIVNGTRNVAGTPTEAAALAGRDLLKTAYTDAAGRGGFTTVADDTLGGKTFFAGVHRGGALDLPLDNGGTPLVAENVVTLDAEGVASAVFIFQAASTLITAASTTVNLINGAQDCNVFWQVGSSATLGASSVFRGTILAHTSITVGSSATVLNGRLLAGVGASADAPSSDTGALTMKTNTVTKPTCAAAATAAPATAAPATAAPAAAAPVEREPRETPTRNTPAPTAAPTAAPTEAPTPAPTAAPTVAGVQAAAPITSLPSTSTADLSVPLALLVVLLLAIGLFMLRSPVRRS